MFSTEPYILEVKQFFRENKAFRYFLTILRLSPEISQFLNFWRNMLKIYLLG